MDDTWSVGSGHVRFRRGDHYFAPRLKGKVAYIRVARSGAQWVVMKAAARELLMSESTYHPDGLPNPDWKEVSEQRTREIAIQVALSTGGSNA